MKNAIFKRAKWLKKQLKLQKKLLRNAEFENSLSADIELLQNTDEHRVRWAESRRVQLHMYRVKIAALQAEFKQLGVLPFIEMLEAEAAKGLDIKGYFGKWKKSKDYVAVHKSDLIGVEYWAAVRTNFLELGGGYLPVAL